MNYRQMITAIIENLMQAERNMNGLHDRGKNEEIEVLTHKLFAVRYLAAGMADDSYAAIKKYLKNDDQHVETSTQEV